MRFRVLHTADLHFTNHADKLQEVVRTTDYLLEQAAVDPPDVIIVSGDSVDEYDGRIRLDSDAARAAISFVQRAADIAPVVIIRGTKSHDKEAPYIFRHLRARFPIHVSTEIEQVALVSSPLGEPSFRDLVDAMHSGDDVKCALTLVPSVDKANLAAMFPGSVRDGNLLMREVLHDLFAGLGLVNEQIPAGIPRVLVTHGMVTGAQFSSGQTAIGEDLEFGVDDLLRANADLYCLGHVHKFQAFAGKIFYSGSPGRLNFGEQEEKGFLVHEFTDASRLPTTRFVPTPARSFCFGEVAWDGDAAAFEAEVARVEAGCSGADVRFRYSIPEEDRHLVDRASLEQRLLAAGASRAKIECQVIPKTRQRAAGISQMQSLPEKVQKWGATVGVDIPESVLSIASVIEGVDVEEILTSIDGGDINEAAKAA